MVTDALRVIARASGVAEVATLVTPQLSSQYDVRRFKERRGEWSSHQVCGACLVACV